MEPWKKIDEKSMYKGYRNIIRRRFLLPNEQEADFDIIDVPSFVCVAAITLDEQVILVEQYRPGPEDTMVSFPEGRIDPGEEPLQAVERELLEETGYKAGKIAFLKSIPQAYSMQKKYCYVATDCQKVQEQMLDEFEFIRVMTLSIAEFRALMRDAEKTDFNSVDAGYLMLEYLQKI